jgi:hypothetical protein
MAWTQGLGEAEGSEPPVSHQANCRQILHARPSSPTGRYTVMVNGSPTPVFCDMTTAGGGWTKIVDQDLAVAPGYQPIAAWIVGINTSTPDSGQYSILGLMESLKDGPSYELRIDWPALGTAHIQWTQAENPLKASQTPTISNVTQDPIGQRGNGAFRGLAISARGQPAALHGDGDAENGWFWAIGSQSPWEGGVPSFKEPRGGMATKHVRLWLR